jgi:hypothetical protein
MVMATYFINFKISEVSKLLSMNSTLKNQKASMGQSIPTDTGQTSDYKKSAKYILA